MAALGTIDLRDPFPVADAELLPITDYNVVRGAFLGTITLRDPEYPLAFDRHPIEGPYIVRQIRIIYRQLWPAYGQRFPQ
jgi:hypothetical protein